MCQRRVTTSARCRHGWYTRVALSIVVCLLGFSVREVSAAVSCPGNPVVAFCAYAPADESRHANSTLWVNGVQRQLQAAVVDDLSKGMLIQAINDGERVCKPQMFLPLFLSEETWPTAVRSFLYLVALLWCFLGIAIIADIFMASIEVITSSEKTVAFTDPATGQSKSVTVLVWNETIANLTLMALGSSAPEILLAVIETVGKLGEPPSEDGLGVSTIVGSAAFNLLMILAICVVAIPSGERRVVKEVSVFTITSVSSVFAYLWLLVVLQWSSENEITLAEALLTLLMFPVLVVVSFLADKGYFKCGKKTDNAAERQAGGTGAWVTGTGGMGARGYGDTATTSVVVPVRGQADKPAASAQSDPGLLHAPVRASRATYRMNGIRMLTGGERLFVPRERLKRLEEDIKRKAREQLEERKSSDGEGMTQSSRSLLRSTLPQGKVMFTFSSPTYGVLEHQGRVILTVERVGAMSRTVRALRVGVGCENVHVCPLLLFRFCFVRFGSHPTLTWFVLVWWLDLDRRPSSTKQATGRPWLVRTTPLRLASSSLLPSSELARSLFPLPMMMSQSPMRISSAR